MLNVVSEEPVSAASFRGFEHLVSGGKTPVIHADKARMLFNSTKTQPLRICQFELS